MKKELKCKCCDQLKVNKKLIIKLEELRKRIGNKPIIITSGYRCFIHNKEVRGVKNSQHLLGKAVDIYVNGMNNRELARYAKEVGFDFIKIYSGWIHIDMRFQ